MSVSFPQYSRCQKVFHTTHNVNIMSTKHTMSVSFPRCIYNHNISKFSTPHTILISCRRNVRCQSVFHGAFKTTISVSFPHHRRCQEFSTPHTILISCRRKHKVESFHIEHRWSYNWQILLCIWNFNICNYKIIK